MYEETRLKFSNLKKRAKISVGKWDNFETSGFKKKKFGGIDNRGKLKRGEIKRVKFDAEDNRKPNGGYRGNGGDVSRGNGEKFSFRDRKIGEGKFSEGRRTEKRGFRDFENRVFDKRESRDGRKNDGNGENRMFNRRDSRDGGGGDRRNSTGNGEDRSGLLRKNGFVTDENSKKLETSAEAQEFVRKRFYKKNNLAADDSMASFDRPKRKRRLFRIRYRNDTANKRFDDSVSAIAPIDNSTKQKEDSDTEEIAENPEMSQNALFRAIQPTPSIISFVNENLLGRRREIDFRKAGYNVELPSPLDDTPFSTSSDRAKIEESVFRNKLEFFAAAKVSSSFPSPDLPEIAFAGRSNVGKSSLLNSLTRQWGVVRTSDKPGLTQTINFFKLGSKLCLVDLPGYGFAYAKDEVKESWEELVKEYVSTREGLKRVCLLIDTKWGMKARDHELVDLMERSKTKYQIVLTKTDLSFPVDVARRAMQIEESLKMKKSALQPLMMVSSKTGAGIRSLRTVLSNISRFTRL